MSRVDYGLDAPTVTLGTLLAGGGLTVATLAVPTLRPGLPFAILLLLAGAAMYTSSRYGKLLVRDRLLGLAAIGDDDRVLDVGCGRGLLLIGAAKRLRTGRATGLDLWSQMDQLGNRRAATLANAVAEQVQERVEVIDGDMRAMPFSDGEFNVVVTNLAIHNVPTREGRRRTIAEIGRVIAPGGRVAIADLAFTREHVVALREEGFEDVHRAWPGAWFFPPLGVVTARKPE